MSGILTVLGDLALNYGYLGVFAASLAGSIIPFLPVPYLIVVVLLSGRLDPLALGVVAGVGGALGKTTSYLLGRWGFSLSTRKTQQNLEFMGHVVRKYGDLGVFFFAVSPLPDDLYMIPIGMFKFPYWRFLLANAAGKVILSTAVAYFGEAYFQALGGDLGLGVVPTVLLLMVLTVLISFLLARADWLVAYERYRVGGIRAVAEDAPAILRLGRRRREAKEP